MFGEHGFQHVGKQPLAVHGHADDAQAMLDEDARGEEIGGFLHEHDIARPGEDSADHVKRLRDTARHHKFFRCDGRAIVC